MTDTNEPGNEASATTALDATTAALGDGPNEAAPPVEVAADASATEPPAVAEAARDTVINAEPAAVEAPVEPPAEVVEAVVEPPAEVAPPPMMVSEETLASAADEAAPKPAAPPEIEVKASNVPKQGPGVSSLGPSRVGARGGMIVTVFGGGFEPACLVRVDGATVPTEYVDAFSVRFEAPEHPIGKAAIEVENPGGDLSMTALELHFVAGPEIASITPHAIPLDGGVEVTIEGTGFEPGCTINLFGVHAPSALFVSDKLVTFKAPPSQGGPVEGPLALTNPDGIGTRFEDALYYTNLEPRIDRLEPATGWVNGGKAIKVFGKDFHASCVFEIGGVIAETRVQTRPGEAATEAEFVVPPRDAPGEVNVIVKNPDGTSAELANGFKYEPIPAPPKLISVAPAQGATIGGGTTRLSGDNFTEWTRVKIGDVSAVTHFVSAKIIDAEIPPRGMPGAVAIELSDSGITIRQEEAFTYYSLQAPKITGIEPMAGPATGGTKVVIEGEGFPKNAVVRFGRESAKVVAVKSATRIETVTPATTIIAHADVEVTSPETGPGVMKKAFRYDAVPAPVITMVAPPKGSVDGGTEITVEGKNFAEGCTVLFGKVPAMKVRRISGSMIECKSPGGTDGQLVDVIVKNPDGKEVVQRRAFQWDARYR